MPLLKKTALMRFVAITAALVLLFCSAACNTGSASDADALQGEWQVVGTRMTVVLTDEQIMLPNGTFYDYEIDEVNKLIDFSIGSVEGDASYDLGTDSTSGVLMLTLTEDDGQVTQFAKLSDDTAATPSTDGGRDTFAEQTDEMEAS